jgi:PhnB protein
MAVPEYTLVWWHRRKAIPEAHVSVPPIPEGFHSLTPYLIVHDGPGALEWYPRALGAEVRVRVAAPDGRIAHAELQLGTSRFMLASEFPEIGAQSPRSRGGTAVGLLFYGEDVDAMMDRAVAAGAVIKQAIEDKPFGDRMVTLEDPYGHLWYLATVADRP